MCARVLLQHATDDNPEAAACFPPGFDIHGLSLVHDWNGARYNSFMSSVHTEGRFDPHRRPFSLSLSSLSLSLCAISLFVVCLVLCVIDDSLKKNALKKVWMRGLDNGSQFQ